MHFTQISTPNKKTHYIMLENKILKIANCNLKNDLKRSREVCPECNIDKESPVEQRQRRDEDRMQ